MKRSILFVCLLGCSASRSADHPAEIVGTWAHADTDRFSIEIDTIEVNGDGRMHGASYWTEMHPVYADTGGLVRVDTIHHPAFGYTMNWHVEQNADGRFLCVSDAKQTKCAPVQVIPHTSMVYERKTYSLKGEQ